jgi:hypothetical protein
VTTPRTRSHSRSQARRRSLAWRGFLEHLEHRAVPAVFSVTTALDNGDNSSPTPGSLRAAIVSLNTSPDPTNSIEFDIPASGVQTIRPLSAFPSITRPVVLDGFTQSDTPTTLPQIELDGSAAGPSVNGLEFNEANDIIVRGLVINRFQSLDNPSGGNGIVIRGGSGHLIQGNYIGIDITGSTRLGNESYGLYITGEVSRATIGGTTEGAGNVIAASGYEGIHIQGRDHLIAGNRIGTSADGSLPLGNRGVGIDLFGARFTTIGGTTPAARNLISDNSAGGIRVQGDFALIQGNYIGTDASGTIRFGNYTGIEVNSFANLVTIGGPTSHAGNVISGNNADGLLLSGTGSLVQGNIIGATADGSSPLGNAGAGIFLRSAHGSTVGGSSQGAGNLISANGGHGLLLWASGSLIQGNNIGTDLTGTNSLGNTINGIYLSFNADDTTIGGTVPGAGNLVSANLSDGIYILAERCLVQGNRVGTDASGSAPLGNAGIGIVAGGNPGATVGGTISGAGNLISANGSHGLFISGPGGWAAGNRVGTDASGSAPLGNAGHGIIASSATVGGTAPGAGNLVSSNAGNGIISNGSNVIQGNHVGIDASGAEPLGNGGYGIAAGGTYDIAATIGGVAPGARNVIAANASGGVAVGTPTLVQGNFIGTDVSGSLPLGNGGAGVTLANYAYSTVGGVSSAARNVIAANGSHGIAIQGPGALIQGNLIGTDATGTRALGNSGTGIYAPFGYPSWSSSTSIGGADPGAGNLISANGGGGILIEGSSATILGNRIGTDLVGLAPLGNTGDGLRLGPSATDATIGGAAPGAGNIISGNTGNGIILEAPRALVLGNTLGLGADGFAPLGNLGDGLHAAPTAADLTLGGLAAGAGNLVSANRNGIVVQGSGALIQGNTIGADRSGTIARGNTEAGILLSSKTANATTIGGMEPGAGNLISGNGEYGIRGVETGPDGGFIRGNRIGTNAAGDAAVPNLVGISLVNSGLYTIGGTYPPARNLISGNTGDGVQIYSDLNAGSRVLGNYIGTDASGALPLGNGQNGVLLGPRSKPDLYFQTAYNLIGGVEPGASNLIAHNGGAGIRGLSTLYTRDTFLRNVILNNARLGIDLAGAGVTPNHPQMSYPGYNEPQNYPVLTVAVAAEEGTTRFAGRLDSTRHYYYLLEFYANPAPDPSGHGQGQLYLGTIQVLMDETGRVAFDETLPVSIPDGWIVSATATNISHGGTSEFSGLNVAPTLAGPPSITATAGHHQTFPPDSFVVADYDGFPTKKVTLSVQSGFLSVTLSGSATVEGNGTPHLTLTGDLADLGTSLTSLVYTADPAFSGQDTLSLVVDDQADSALGGPLQASTITSIQVNPGIQIDSAAPPSATSGIPYSANLTATGGTAPVVFSLAEGSSLPPGLTLGRDGLLAGTPTSAGLFGFTVVATDRLGSSASRPLQLVVAAPVAIVPQTPPPATEGIPYLDQLAATGGTAPVSFILAPGSALPPGLSLSTEGLISGTPGSAVALSAFSAAAPYTFTVVATDALGSTASQALTILVAPPVAIVPQTPPAATAGSPYSAQLAATGGTDPVTFSLADGSALPPGLTFSDSGLLSGTPTNPGSFSFTVVATDALGSAASLPLAFSVSAALTTPTTVASLQRFGYHLRPTALVLTFSADLDPSTAQSPANYRVVLLGPGQRARLALPVTSATYDPSSRTVTLRFARRLPLLARYRLTVNASSPGGVTDSSGQLIDGSGSPGTDYVRTFGPRLLAGPTPPSSTPATTRRAGLFARPRGGV